MSTIRPEGWLVGEDVDRAKKMEDEVLKLWAKPDSLIYHTPHNPAHFSRVESLIRKLIPEEKWPKLLPTERMLLTWGSWTHDIGMNKVHYKDDQTEWYVRKHHVEKALEWVWENQERIGLTTLEAQVLANIIKYHSRKHPIAGCVEQRMCGGELVKVRLLASYLRLADALDVAQTRTGDHTFPILENFSFPEKDEVLFHWVKSFVVSDLRLNHAKQLIEVEFQMPTVEDSKDDPAIDPRYDLLRRHVELELKDELATVESILDKGGLSSFHDVLSSGPVPIADAARVEWTKSLPRVLSYLHMAYSPNSTEVARAALQWIKETIQRANDGVTLKQYLGELEQSLKSAIEHRKCHVEVRRIRGEVVDIRTALEKSHSGTGHKEKLRKYVDRFEELLAPDRWLTNELTKNLELALEQVCPREARKSWCFLLFGCSESIATALSSTDFQQHETTVYIAEGRPKSDHGPHNTPTKVDAEAYASLLRSRGFKGKIHIIPDACVGTVIDRHRDAKNMLAVDAVLLGTNGIFWDPNLCVAHTAGHLTLAIVADYFNIPVLVAASAAKIWQRQDPGWDSDLREGQWMTSHPEVLERIDRARADLTWNPHEEHVPIDLVSALVTDRGTLYFASKKNLSRNLGSTCEERQAKDLLRKWSNETDKYLRSGSHGNELRVVS